MAYLKSLVLETERLLIKPLSHSQLLLYTALNNALEQSLDLNAYTRTLPIELKEALEQVILPQVAAAGENLLYCTLWTMIDKKGNVMVGDLCFKGAPNAQGEIEVGYGTYSDFQGRGFMTEALGELSRWALTQPGVQAVVAETDKQNTASHITLSKNNFNVYKQIEAMIWWRLDKQ